MLIKQNYCCAICLKPEKSLNNKKTKICRLAVDHCHKTGKIRQLLCANCNKTLGLIKEDTDVLKKMIDYIGKHDE